MRARWWGVLGLFLAGCPPEPECDVNEAPRCEGDAVVTCEEGRILRVSCVPNECIPETASCNVCGDGVVGFLEECDDGCLRGTPNVCEAEDNATVKGDTCEADCTEKRCDNGILDFGEFTECYATEITFPAGLGTSAVALADFDQDGRLDLLVGNADASDIDPDGTPLPDVQILRNAPNGSFPVLANLPLGSFANNLFDVRSVAAAQLNDDGIPDVVAVSLLGRIAFYLSQGAPGAYDEPIIAQTGQNEQNTSSDPISLEVGDLDGDGRDDVAYANTEAFLDSVGIFFQAQGFVVEVREFADFPRDIELGDMNGDGALDIVVAEFNSRRIRILENDGLGNFTPNVSAPLGGQGGLTRLALADLDGDGQLDVVAIQDNVVKFLKNDGSGQLTEDVSLEISLQVDEVAVTDLEPDGDADIALLNTNEDDARVDNIFLFITSNGIPAFDRGFDIQGTIQAEFTIGDLNGDVLPEMIIPAARSGSVSVIFSAF